jgi:SAM-dependent methyltransferase
MTSHPLLHKVERYYSAKFEQHGATAQGVDWNSEDSQRLRFEQLLKAVDPELAFTLNDYGCGYGALADYLDAGRYDFRYVGYDVSPTMRAHAERSHAGDARVAFAASERDLTRADYTVASGIFNVKLDVAEGAWATYVEETIGRIAALSRRGFAFNMLTSYSDPELMRPDLFYGDPRHFFDLCRRRYARNVALLHDYGLYEFTVIIRLDV